MMISVVKCLRRNFWNQIFVQTVSGNKMNQSKTSTIFFYYGGHFSAHIIHLNFIKPEATHLQLAVSMRVTMKSHKQ